MKILLDGFAEYIFFFREVVKFTIKNKFPFKWSIILNTHEFLQEYENLLGKENVLCIQEKLNEYMRKDSLDLDLLSNFQCSIYEWASASKEQPGHITIKSKSREYQLKLLLNTYIILKEFLIKINPDYVLFPIIEAHSSLILYHLSNELNIKPIIVEHARNLGLTFFTNSLDGNLPDYAYKITPDNETIKKAIEFINLFRQKPTLPFEIKYSPKPDEIIKIPELNYRKNIFLALSYFIKKRIRKKVKKYPHMFDRYTLIHKLRILFLPLTEKYRNFKAKFQKLHYDIHKLDELPQKFVYYPLQYTPEVSINILAPYFVDQLRTIDLITNALPPDYYLIVKEHPFMKGIRKISFYTEIKKRANILLADFSLPSLEITKRAHLTISVTGTACLEAFLLGKPSLHLGRAFFSNWIYKFDSFYSFKEVIKEAIASKEVPMEKIVDFVSRIFSIGYEFVLFNPEWVKPDFVMNKRNITKFCEALYDHIQKLSSS